MRRIFLLFCFFFLVPKLVYASYLEEKAIDESQDQGSFSGDYTDTWYSDNVYEIIEEINPVGYQTDSMQVRYVFNLSYPYWRSTLHNFDIVIEGYSSSGESAVIYIYNSNTDNWEVVGTAISSNENVYSFTISPPGLDYVSDTGKIYLAILDYDNYEGEIDEYYIDYVAVKPRYFPLFKDWCVANETTCLINQTNTIKNSFWREDKVKVVSQWYSPSNLSKGIVTFTGTGAEEEFSSFLTINKSSDILFSAYYYFNFSNYTMFPTAGKITIYRINVTNEQGLYNTTPSDQSYNFYLWSKAKILDLWLSNEVEQNNNLIYNSSTYNVFCKVVDAYSQYPIPSYPVKFYFWINNTSKIYLGQNLTNASGITSVTINSTVTDRSLGYYNLSCEIQPNSSLYYNVSIGERKEIVKIMDMKVLANTSVKRLSQGESLEIIGKIQTEGSGISSAWATLSYSDINLSSQKLENKVKQINLTCTKVSSYLYNCSSSFIPESSGTYYITLYAKSDFDGRIRENKTSFFVNYGDIEVNFTYPNYRILKNQTFNQTIKLTAINGDLWNVSLNFTLLQEGNVLVNISPTIKEGIYLKKGIPVVYNFTLFSKNTGLAKIILEVRDNFNLSKEFQEMHEVVNPIIEIYPSKTNLSDDVDIKAKIVGNLSNIENVNLTIVKPFSEGTENLSLSFLKKVDESLCFSGENQSKNIASISYGGHAIASYNQEGANLSINDNENDYWNGLNKGNITFIFNGTYTISRIEILAKSDEPSNITLYYYRGGTWNTLLTEAINTSKHLHVLTQFTPFYTSKIKLEYNLSGNIYLYEFRVYSVSVKLGSCYIYNVTYRPDFSGKYNGTLNIYLKEGISSSNLSFSVNYGKPRISFFSEPYYFIPGDGEIEVKVVAEGGDLRNITLILSSENISLINITSPPFHNITILNNQSVTFSFNCTVSNVINERRINLTLNISSKYNITGKKKILAIVVANDTNPPIIHQAYLSYNTSNLYGVGSDLLVYVNATDNETMITKIEINISNLKYNQTIFSTEKIDDSNIWIARINNSFLNLTGNYSIKVYAWDVKNRAKYQKNLSLHVSNVLFVEPRHTYLLFNKGENLSFFVKNVNNNTISSFNWTLYLEHQQSNFSLNISGTGNKITYFINSTFPIGKYLLKINVSKRNNVGNLSLTINVSDRLYPEFVYYRQDLVSYLNVDLAPIYINVYNARKDTLLSNYSVEVSLLCPNSHYSTLPFQSSFGEYSNIFYLSSGCKTPFSYDTQYSIKVEAKDIFNNSGETSLSFRTSSPITGGGGGGGGSARGSGTAFFQGNITENKTIYIYKNVTFTKKDFSVNLTKQELFVISGEREAFTASIVNTGDEKLDIAIVGTCACCNLSFEQTKINLRPRESKDIKIEIYIPLYQKENCFAKLLFINATLQKEKSIKISVIPNPLLHKAEVVSSKLSVFYHKLNKYKEVGLDIEDLQKEVEEIQTILTLAREAIYKDNLTLLRQYLEKAMDKSEKLEKSFLLFDKISLILKYKYLILFSLASCLAIAYWIMNITIPLIKLKKQLQALKRKEALIIETRKNTERQYFHRKISEDVFNKIMIEEQNKLLKVRSEIKEIEKKINRLLHFKPIK